MHASPHEYARSTLRRGYGYGCITVGSTDSGSLLYVGGTDMGASAFVSIVSVLSDLVEEREARCESIEVGDIADE